MSKLTIALLSTCAAALLLPPREAEACTPPSCMEARFAVESMPASAPAIPFRADSSPADGSIEVSLSADGAAWAPVPGALQGADAEQVFVPASPLAPGGYTLRYRRACNTTPGSKPMYADSGFTVTAAVPLPTVAGSVAVKAASRETIRAVTSAGSCFDDVDAAIVDLELTLDAGTAPYADVLRYETVVDGKRWTTTAANPSDINREWRSHLRLFAACDDRAAHNGRDHGLSEGSHLVEIRPFLAGTTELLVAARLQVTVACDASNGTVQPLPPDSGSSSGGSSSGGSSGAAGAEPQDSSEAGNGCSMHSGPASANAVALAALGALLLARRRQRA